MNFNYHIYKPDIVCPYCDKDCYDDAQDLEEIIEYQCEHCGKYFYIEASIVYSTYSNCELNNKEHDFEQSKYHPTVFNCKNCYFTDVRLNETQSPNKR